jgi:diguanylate cyclase (GGDEF)-like protein/PAS domain S-box-containing protein
VRHNESVRLSGAATSRRTELLLVTVITLTFTIICISFQLLENIYSFVRDYFSLDIARFTSNFVFLYLGGLLWLTYYRWRNSDRRSRELEDIVSSISPDVLLVVNSKGKIAMSNDGVQRMFGYTMEEVLDREPDLLRHDVEGCPKQDQQVYDGREGFCIGVATGRKKNGDTLPIEIITGRLSDGSGAVMLLRDITERKNAELALNRAYAELDQIFNIAADGIWVIDRDYTIVRTNDILLALVDLPKDAAVGRKCYEVIACRNHLGPGCPLDRVMGREGRLEYETEISRKDGKIVPLHVTVAPFQDAEGNVTGIIEDFRDITDHKRMEEELRALSISDELTGLFNRRGFISLLQQQVKVAQRHRRGMFLFFVDVDRMKWINDTLGHGEGDRALIETARILETTFRSSDIIARIGGDEFAVVAVEADLSAAEVISERLRGNIGQANSKGEREYELSLSVGRTYCDPDQPCEIDEMMRRADTAMYEDKRHKKGSRAGSEHVLHLEKPGTQPAREDAA